MGRTHQHNLMWEREKQEREGKWATGESPAQHGRDVLWRSAAGSHWLHVAISAAPNIK